MINIQPNEYIKKIEDYKNSLEEEFKKFNVELEFLGNPTVQINFKIDNIKDQKLRDKILLIRVNLEKLIQIYNSKDWNRKINMEEIKNIINEGFENVENNYKSIINNLNPVINRNNSLENENNAKMKSLKEKYKKIYEKTIDKLIEEIKNFIKLLNNFVDFSKGLAEEIHCIIDKSESYFNKDKNLNGDKLIKGLFLELTNFIKCFEKHNEHLDCIINFVPQINIFQNLQLIIDKINTNILSINSKINLNKILKEINIFEHIKKQKQYLEKYYIKNQYFEKIEIFKFNILFVFDITSTMQKHINNFVKNFDKIFQGIKENCPLSIIYTGFIGYKDINDLELGDEYIDIDFTLFHEKILTKIKNIQTEGGDDIPEDVAGAFELALKKKWNNGTNIIFLVTDAPCHGTKYHELDQNNENLKDNFPDEEYGENQNFRREKIENLVENFVEKNYNLVCLDIQHKNTQKMFKMFEEKYNEKKKEKLFSVSKDNFDKCVIKKVTELYKENEENMISILNKNIESNNHK